MKFTIDEIARLAHVSKGTVSRVINDRSTVARETRERVLAVMKRLNYEPDPVARELSKRTKHTLGIWVGAGTNRLAPYFNLIWRALLREMQVRATQFVEVPVELSGLRRHLDAMLLFDTAGIDHRLALLAARQTPAVLIGHYPGISCVAPDDRGGGALAAERILALGHRGILHLGAGEETEWGRDRAEGFRAGVAGSGATLQVVHGTASVLGGYRLMREVWTSGARPSAVFCATDEMAVGVLGALEDLGVAVPGEVSVVGFDGLRELHPGLASVAQDIPAIAHVAVSLALAVIEKNAARQKVVPVTFLEGATLGPSPRAPRDKRSGRP